MTDPWDDGESAYEVRSRQSCSCGCQDGTEAESPYDLAPALRELARRLGVLGIGGIGHTADYGGD